MKNGYTFNPETQSYQFVDSGRVMFTTRKIAVCYAVNEDDSTEVLHHGVPEEVSRVMATVEGAHVAAFAETCNDLHYYEGDLPEEDLNQMLEDPDHVRKLHPLIQRLKLISNRKMG